MDQEIFGQEKALNSTRLGIFLKVEIEKRQEILGNVAQKMMTWDFGCGTGLIKFVDLIDIIIATSLSFIKCAIREILCSLSTRSLELKDVVSVMFI